MMRIVTACALLALPTLGEAAQQSAEWCERQWKAVSSELGRAAMDDGDARLLARWKELAPQCDGTVAYEARLAMALALAGQDAEARRVLGTVQGKRSRFGHLVEFAELQIPYLAVARDPTLERLAALEPPFAEFVRRHPSFPEGHAQLGALRTMTGEHREAIGSLERARSSSMDLSGVYRNLAISYEAVGQHEKAYQAADEAYARRSDLLRVDPQYVYAMARAAAALGKADTAEKALKIVVLANPGVKDDPEFRAAVQLVLARKAAEAQAPAR